MSEIDRVIALAKSFKDEDIAILELRYCFAGHSDCQSFYRDLKNQAIDAAENFQQQLVAPKPHGDQHLAAIKLQVTLDTEPLRQLCHHYRDMAAKYQGAPLKWLVRIKNQS